MTNGALTKLTDALADHFEDADLSRTVVRQAEIEDRLVPYEALPVVRWRKIVELAIEQKKLESLVDRADELRGNSSLRELFDEWNAPLVMPPTPEPPRKRLPHPWLTPWVGREREMVALDEALRASRLVTLHGTGGVGKTRLAVETLLARGDALPQEMVFVALENVADKPEAVLTAVRDALGLTEVDAPSLDVLCRRLHGTDLLLLLDNFESVMSAVDLVQRLVGTVGVRVLVTSQHTLDISGERVVELQPMLSKTKDDLGTLKSFRLFVELARHRDPKWQPEDNEAMREVLVATDGLPYLIELVAAAAPKRRLRQLADDLKTRLKEVRARHALVARQASVQACLEWVLARLPVEERNTLPRLAIFAGGFDATAALEVAATPIASLDVLVDASLLRFDREAGRYSMLFTTRQFARELLSDEEHARLAEAHARWFIERLDRADDALRAKGAETQAAALRWIDAESDNVQQGVEWAEEKEPGLFENAVFAYAVYLRQRCRFSENVRLNEALLRRLSPEDAPQTWATTQNNLGGAYFDLPTGDRSESLAKAIACYEAALSVRTEHDFPAEWAITQNNLGTAYRGLPTDRNENLARAIACFEAALRVWTERDFPAHWAGAHNNLGNTYADLPTNRNENLAKAIACYEAALRVWTERDSPAYWAMTQNNLGTAYADLPTDRSENLAKAIACYETTLRVWTERDFPMEWSTTQNNLGIAYRNLSTGDRSENVSKAIDYYQAALRVWTERDFPVDWAMTQNNLGTAYFSLPTGDHSENLTKAIACFEAALRVRTECDFPAEWAMTQFNLGLTYEILGTTENRQQAILCYESAARGYAAVGLTDKVEDARHRAAALADGA